LDNDCGAGELEADNAVCAPEEDESRETLDDDCGAFEFANAVCGPDGDGAPLDNSCEALELETANGVCVPADGGEFGDVVTS
jgi:hypothetical protein